MLFFFLDETEFIIITGPNMGGKSTYIRQVIINGTISYTTYLEKCQKKYVSDELLALNKTYVVHA